MVCNKDQHVDYKCFIQKYKLQRTIYIYNIFDLLQRQHKADLEQMVPGKLQIQGVLKLDILN